jgi:hypothetical protein
VWHDDFRPVNHLGFGQATASPARSKNVNVFGAITVEVDTELAKLDAAGYRPLADGAPPVLGHPRDRRDAKREGRPADEQPTALA